MMLEIMVFRLVHVVNAQLHLYNSCNSFECLVKCVVIAYGSSKQKVLRETLSYFTILLNCL